MNVVGIIVGAAQVFQDILGVGYLGIVDFRQHVLAKHPLNNVVGGEAHVKGAGIGFHLHDHIFVGGKAHVVHMDAGLLLKLDEDALIDVVFPVEHVDDLLRGRAHGQHQHKGNQDAEELLHGDIPPV